MAALILHLSDIHIRTKEDPILVLDKQIAKTTFEHINSDTTLFIAVSGDIAFSGAESEYDLALSFFEAISSHIKSECEIPIHYVFCPGNHDCNFSDNGTRKYIIDNMTEANLPDITNEVYKTCTMHQKNYFEFAELLGSENIKEQDWLWTTHSFKVGKINIVFESINLAWCSKLNEDQGKIVFPFDKYSDKFHPSTDVRISIMHHPMNWFTQKTYRDFRVTAKQGSDLVLTGHEHINNPTMSNDLESAETIILEAGTLQEGTIVGSSFGIIKLDIDESKNTFYKYEYNADKKSYSKSSEFNLSPIKNKTNRAFNLKTAFEEMLDDCGAYFKHSNTAILKLSDIYIYPDLKDKSDASNSTNIKSSKTLVHSSKSEKGIIIASDETAGTTSLLYVLFQEFYAQGKVPILLNGRDIKNKHSSNLDLQVDRALKRQFSNEDTIAKFSQLTRDNKVLLIDDYDESPLKSESAQNEALKYLSSKFSHIILTVDSMFDIGNFASVSEDSCISDFNHYNMQPFGYLKRSEMVRKWYTVGQQDIESSSEIDHKCNVAESLMDSVMDKSLITPHPIYLLTFLQSIEAGQSSQLTDSALGHYYSYLLNQGFIDSGVKNDELGVEFDYAKNLARFFHKKNTDTITELDLKTFNTDFSEKWHETDYETKKKTLLNSKVLEESNGEYRFKYAYNYYYLIGLFLSENILDPSIHQEITDCITHLYVRKNANTILFLAHHSSHDNVLVLMKDATDKLFNTTEPASFNGDCRAANELIKSAPVLKFNNQSPEENRKQISGNRDVAEKERKDDFLTDKEEKHEDLPLATKLTMLFKTIEILSQIIKSNPTKFERTKKVEILKSIFAAPLRALQGFYLLLEEHPQALLDAIAHEISVKSRDISKEDRAKIASKTVASIIQSISAAFILKTAKITNSKKLLPDISTLMNNNDSLAYRLIECAISLDNHNKLQRGKITNLFEDCEDNLVALKILDVVLINRLHMYKTSEQDLQWLSNLLGYDLKMGHRISYNKNSKLIKGPKL